MILYKLDAETTTKIPVIDSQHKELFDRVNTLIDALSKGKGREKVGEIIEFLESYVKVHLSTEEDIMIKNKYAGLEEHKKKHDEFRGNVANLKREFVSMGASSHLAILVQQEIGDWFMNHIRTVDMKYVPYLKDKV